MPTPFYVKSAAQDIPAACGILYISAENAVNQMITIGNWRILYALLYEEVQAFFVEANEEADIGF